ncbi:MAG: hypothetical protein KGV46_02075 [Pasteurella sp.]|nr:hypothetical protein [Pasteurella sp.]
MKNLNNLKNKIDNYLIENRGNIDGKIPALSFFIIGISWCVLSLFILDERDAIMITVSKLLGTLFLLIIGAFYFGLYTTTLYEKYYSEQPIDANGYEKIKTMLESKSISQDDLKGIDLDNITEKQYNDLCTLAHNRKHKKQVANRKAKEAKRLATLKAELKQLGTDDEKTK